MKRKIFSLAVIALATFASISSFAAPSRDKDRIKKDRPCREARACKGDSTCRKAFSPFEKLSLTPDQKAKIEQLNKDRFAARQAKIKEARGKDKVKRDSVSPEQRRQLKQERRLAVNKERAGYLKSVKDILTPEQYVEFLEINYTQAPVKMKGIKKDSRHDGKRDGKRDGKHDKSRKGDRPDKKAPKVDRSKK